MRINSETYSFLTGEKFSNAFTLKIPSVKYPPVSREEAIIDIVKGSNIVHMGCADHIEVIDEKIKSGKWLHKLITENSNDSIGIDINPTAVDYIKSSLGYKNVLKGNVLEENIEELTLKNWDWVVFGEIIEHLDNPVTFLNEFKKKYKSNISKFLITVPTVYNSINLKNLKKHTEIINSDHRYWFTPYTISKVLVEAGLKPEEITFANLKSLTFTELAIRKIFKLIGLKRKYPFYNFNTIIITGSL